MSEGPISGGIDVKGLACGCVLRPPLPVQMMQEVVVEGAGWWLLLVAVLGIDELGSGVGILVQILGGVVDLWQVLFVGRVVWFVEGGLLRLLELFQTLLELSNVEPLVGVEVADLEGLRNCLLLLVDAADSLPTLRVPPSLVLFSHLLQSPIQTGPYHSHHLSLRNNDHHHAISGSDPPRLPNKMMVVGEICNLNVLEGSDALYKNQLMAQSEIAGYITYWPEEALSQSKKLPFYFGLNTIGRATKCRVCIKDQTVSNSHARLMVSADKMVLVDTSTNGVFIDSKEEKRRFEKNVEVEVFDGMRLLLGEVACQINRNPIKFTEQTMTLVRPVERKKDSVIEAMFGSDNQEEIRLDSKKQVKKQLENKEVNELGKNNDIDEFSLGLLEDFDKKENKGKKQKQAKKTKQVKEEKKEVEKEVDQKNKKAQKKTSLEKLKQQKETKQELKELKSKGNKIEEKYIVKQPQYRISEEIPKTIKHSKEKQEKIKRQKEEMLKKQMERQQKMKRDRQLQKNKEKQERQARLKQQQQRKLRQEQQKKRMHQKQRGKSKGTQRAVLKEQKGGHKQAETTAQQLNESLRNDKKSKLVGDQDTKRRVSRKRLPSKSSSIDFYPLRRSFINKRILISGFVPSLTKKYFCIVDKIDEEFDYLVMKEYKRTFKALYAICKGIHILKYDWVRQSEFLEKTLKPEGYIFKQHEVIYNSIEKVNQGLRVFKGYEFYLGSDEYHLSVEDIEALIYAGGGEVIKKVGKLSSKEKEQKNKIAVIRNWEQKSSKVYDDEVKRARKLGFDDIYSIQMILDSCEKQEIDWAKNKAVSK